MWSWPFLFVVVARIEWGVLRSLQSWRLSIAASARQAPLHALTTEIVGPEIRGEYIAVRNAASQLGIARWLRFRLQPGHSTQVDSWSVSYLAALSYAPDPSFLYLAQRAERRSETGRNHVGHKGPASVPAAYFRCYPYVHAGQSDSAIHGGGKTLQGSRERAGKDRGR